MKKKIPYLTYKPQQIRLPFHLFIRQVAPLSAVFELTLGRLSVLGVREDPPHPPPPDEGAGERCGWEDSPGYSFEVMLKPPSHLA